MAEERKAHGPEQVQGSSGGGAGASSAAPHAAATIYDRSTFDCAIRLLLSIRLIVDRRLLRRCYSLLLVVRAA